MNRVLAARSLATAAAVLAVSVPIIGGMLASGHSHVADFISELGAVGTPWGRAVSLGGFLPTGLVSFAFPANAAFIWGLSTDEYERAADVWPLNPEGDLLATMMIESSEALKNLDRIAAVPGVGALFPGAGSDLSRSLGVSRDSPELEAAFQQILSTCKARKVACAITAPSADDVVRRVKEGWNIIRSTVPAIQAARPRLAR